MKYLEKTLQLIAKDQDFTIESVKTTDNKTFMVCAKFDRNFNAIPATLFLAITKGNECYFTINNLEYFYNSVGVEKYYLQAKELLTVVYMNERETISDIIKVQAQKKGFSFAGIEKQKESYLITLGYNEPISWANSLMLCNISSITPDTNADGTISLACTTRLLFTKVAEFIELYELDEFVDVLEAEHKK